MGRAAALLALIAASLLVAYLLFGGDDYTVTAKFENASQLVEGNEVTIAGEAVGSVKEIRLSPDNEALVTFSVEEEHAPLPRGTVATVDQYSLSAIAGRKVELIVPPKGRQGAPIPDQGLLAEDETVSAVDLDQLFNTLDERTVRNLKKVIKGFEVSYSGVSEQANRGFKYLNPFLYSSRRVFGELTRDQRAFERLLVDTDRLSGTLASRRDDISALIANLNLMMGAIGRQRVALAEAIGRLPDFMRRFNTTAVNLRATLDDLDPLVDASKPVALKLQPFFREFRAASADLVPTVRDLDAIVRRPGRGNDLVELTRLQPPLARAALGSGRPDCGSDPTTDYAAAADGDFRQGAFGESVCSLRNGLPGLAFFRPYTPELVGWFDDFGHSGQTDANGGFGRISTTFNTFEFFPNLPGIPDFFKPQSDQFAILDTGNLRRCPGTNERNPTDDSTPFQPKPPADPYQPPEGLPCDPSEVPVGP